MVISNWYNFFKDYFGIFLEPLIFSIILDFLFCFIKPKTKRGIYRVRLLFFLIFIFTTIIISVLAFLSNKGILDENTIIITSIMDLNLGFVMTYLITFLFNNFPLKYIYIAASVIIGISLFFLIGKEISNFLKFLIKIRCKRKAHKFQRAVLKSKRIEEAKEKAREKAKEKINKEIAKEQRIKKEEIE